MKARPGIRWSQLNTVPRIPSRLVGTRAALLGALAIVVLAAPGSGQAGAQEGIWRGRAGFGLGIHATCDECRSEHFGGAMTLGGERRIGASLALGLTWTGVWLDGRVSALSRHALTADLIFGPRSRNGLFLRVGLGPTLATTVQVEGTPSAPEAGDIVVGIGETMGLGGSVGVGARGPIFGSVFLAPELRFLAQVVDGERVAVGALVFSLEVG